MGGRLLYDLVQKEYKESKFYRNHFKIDVDNIAYAEEMYREVAKEMDNPQAIKLSNIFVHSAIVLNKEELTRLKDLLLKLTVMGEGKYLHKAFNYNFWQMLLTVIGRLKVDYDYMLVIDGYEGVGKSTFALSLAYFYRYIVFGDKKLDNYNLALSPLDVAQSFLDLVSNDLKMQPLIFDEGGTVMFSRDAMGKFGKKIIKVLKVARMMNWFLIVVSQDISWIDPYIRCHRVTGWVNIPARGKATFVPGKALKQKEEFLARHFNPEKLIKSLPHYYFGFSDFDFDDNILKWYMEKKKNYVFNMVEEMQYDIVELQNVYAKQNKEQTLDIAFLSKVFPFVAPAKLTLLTFPQRDTFAKVLSSWQYHSICNFVNHANNDDFGKFFFGSENNITNISLDMLRENFGLSEMVLRSIRTEFKKLKSRSDFWVYGFDLWRFYVSGLAFATAFNYLREAGCSPSSLFVLYAWTLKNLLNCKDVFSALLLANYPIPSELKIKLTTLMLERSKDMPETEMYLIKDILNYLYAYIPAKKQIEFLRNIYYQFELFMHTNLGMLLTKKSLSEDDVRVLYKILTLPIMPQRSERRMRELPTQIFKQYFNKEFKRKETIFEKWVKHLLEAKFNVVKPLTFTPRTAYESVRELYFNIVTLKKAMNIFKEIIDKIEPKEAKFNSVELHLAKAYINTGINIFKDKISALESIHKKALEEYENLRKKLPKEEAKIEEIEEEKKTVSEVLDLFMQLDKAIDQYAGEKEVKQNEFV